MESDSNQPPAKHSSTYHVCPVLDCPTNTLLTSITFFSVINSVSKGKWINRQGKAETWAVKD